MNEKNMSIANAIEYFTIMFLFFLPLQASVYFNIERSNTTGIGNSDKFALYTQIASHPFTYNIVAYESDNDNLVNKNETQVNNVVLKLDLINKNNNKIINTSYAYFNASSKSRLSIENISISQSFREVSYKISTKIDTNNTKPFHAICTNIGELKRCYDNIINKEVPYDSQDTFSIRPALFNYILKPTSDVNYNNNIDSDTINLRTGDEYSLEVYAYDLEKNRVSNYSGTSTSTLIFQGSNQCVDKNNTLFSGQSFLNGVLHTSITQEETATYTLNITDNSWTQSDRIKGDCIEGSNAISADDSSKSGCNISSSYPLLNYNDKNITFMVDHFELNITKQTYPENLGKFLYMHSLKDPENLMSLELNGTIIAKSDNNTTLKNFTTGCMATELSLGFNLESSPTLNHLLGEDNTTRFFLQYSHNSTAPVNIESNITNNLIVDATEFNEKAEAKLRLNLNIDRNSSLAINPLNVQFSKLYVESNGSKSIFGLPKGELNDLGENTFLYAKTRASQKYYHVNEKAQITPISIDIYCQNLPMDANITCQDYGSATSFSAEGWWLATAYRLLNSYTDIKLEQGNTKEGTGTLSFKNNDPISIPVDGIGLSDSNSSVNAINDTVSNICPGNTPFETEVILHPDSSNWIEYKDNILYSIYCFGNSQWSGVGDEATTLDGTSSLHKNKRTSW